ncbi:MAG TPA: rhodanese-like domain-containing protein [Desulfobacteraceae bacterium]|nr:rhodanese-like domain-containing protein [Desulfobacteraceae bacterium]HPJ68823.1 rhodanese-like domain-containing protein [Desulfobacteraceae bacterium]HPQ29913.1 rhodanese-like domain-containing protein [Desulfobacteraceae bacterium]
MFQDRLKGTLWQIPMLILLSALIALSANHFRSRGIPLISDWSAKEHFTDEAGDCLCIPLEQAEHLFKQGAALFVDARPESQYEEEHIQYAINLPWQKVDLYFAETADKLEGYNAIIAYCDGESCDLGHELAIFLKDMGFENVYVLFNGLTVWRNAGMPVEVGK